MATEEATEVLEAPAVDAPDAAPDTGPDANGTPAKADKAESKKKEPKKGKDKESKKGKEKAPPADGPSIAAYPRAARSVALTKGWCGLAGFIVGGYLALPTSTFAGAGLRALIAGAICYVAGWGAAVFVWRRLVVFEIKAREQQLVADVLARNAPRAEGGRDAP